jgi:NAD(P)-dependent dehydrogenase (short-subunit alcohol dehydrogenase family)
MGLLDGKTALVTGATAGIGKVIAEKLAREGADLTIVGRNPEKTAKVRGEIVAATGNARVEVLLADLSVMKQVRGLAQSFAARHDKLHVLVNNAGAWNEQRVLTADGLETTFAVNHLAYFVLTNELLPLLKSSSPARIVNMASAAHKSGRVDLDDLQSERGYFGFRVYSNSKLMNVLFTRELARRLDGSGVVANCVHPGTVASEFGSNNDNILGKGWNLLRPFMRSVEKGAEGAVHLATAPEAATINGKYWKDKGEVWSTVVSKDMELAGKLWAASEALAERALGG